MNVRDINSLGLLMWHVIVIAVTIRSTIDPFTTKNRRKIFSIFLYHENCVSGAERVLTLSCSKSSSAASIERFRSRVGSASSCRLESCWEELSLGQNASNSDLLCWSKSESIATSSMIGNDCFLYTWFRPNTGHVKWV